MMSATRAPTPAHDDAYRLMVEAAHDGIFLCETDGRIAFANPAFAAICGRPVDALIGTPIADVIAPEDLATQPLGWDALRRTGCTLCLDDFGSGFASFAYLKHLKVDVLKIDGMFIRDLPREQGNQVFVRSIVEVARSMGQRTVAEFVEDAETLKLLREYGVDFVQGHYLDRPRANHPALGK